MLITVILILLALVVLNFLLLIFSCNKSSKVITNQPTISIIEKNNSLQEQQVTEASTQLDSPPLAATGS